MSRPAASSLRLAPAVVEVERRPDGSMLLRSPEPLARQAGRVSDWLIRWATEAPDRVFLAERRAEDWERVTYSQTLERVRRIAQGLLDRGLSKQAPLMVLSDNSMEHALLALAAMHVGVPVAPISPAYSLMSQDHAKLRQIAALVRPGAVYAADAVRYGSALGAIGCAPLAFEELMAVSPTRMVDELNAQVTPDTVAKILFTSGSTGAPKGVVNTQRMITANQQQSLQVWPFLGDAPPVVVDWLPWNHTFGGNYNFHMVLSNGGTLYIDGGKPVPGLIETTVRNLKDVPPTLYCNVPRGFDLLLPFLEQDAQLRRTFFSRCSFIFYAGAALPQNLWERMMRLAEQERGGDLALVSAWGATETAPLCTAVHFPIRRAGIVGLPVPGCELKLVPDGGKLEARVRGPHVMPGYFERDDLSKDAFDEEGFYRIGDALRFDDPDHPEQGLVFDGRVAEDFKLRTGTWVHVGALRVQLLAACDSVVQDAVITGHDRDEVGALLFLHPSGAALPESTLRERIALALAEVEAHNGTGSAGRIARARVLAQPPRPDAGEITDKGYINQRAVLQARAPDVELLYAAVPDDVIFPAAPASSMESISA